MKRKILSIALTLFMIVNLVPIMGGSGYAAGTNNEPIATLFFASDYQDKSTDPQLQMSNLMDKVKEQEGQIDNAILCGDYTNGIGYNYGDNPAPNINIIKELVRTKFGADTQSMFLQGNHDSYDSSLMASDGLHEFDNYMVYILNTQSANPWNQGSVNAKSAVLASANALTSTLNGLSEEQRRKPIFVATHVPLHMSSRTSSKYSSGDNMYASYLFNAINSAAQDLDIVVLFGHNHSHGWDSYLGGSSIYVPKGAVLPVPDCSDVSGRTDKYTNETLNFTYMNAGYVGYYTENTSPADDTLTCTTVKIYPDNMVVTRYDQNGVHKLGSKGSYNINADGGVYNDANGFGSMNGVYGQSAPYSVVNSDIASPQTITRKNEGIPVLIPSLTLLGGNTSVDIGSMDVVSANLKNATATSYSWTTSDPSVAKLLENDKQTVRVEYNKAGSASISCSVSYTAEDGTLETLVKYYTASVNADVVSGSGNRYVKVKDLNELVQGDGYLIITNAENKKNIVEKNIKTKDSRTGLTAEQALAGAGNSEITGNYDAYEWTFEKNGNNWRLQDKANNRYVQVSTGNNYPVSWAQKNRATNFTISKTGTDNFNFIYSTSYVLQLSTNRNIVYGYGSGAGTKDFYIYKKVGASSAEPACEIVQENGNAIGSAYPAGSTQNFKLKLTNISEIESYTWIIQGSSSIASINEGTANTAVPSLSFKREGEVILRATITYIDSENNTQTIETSRTLQIVEPAQVNVDIVSSASVVITDVLQRRYEVNDSTSENIRCAHDIEGAVQYEWTSSDTNIATVVGYGDDARINFTGETGYTYIAVKVMGTDGNGNSIVEERGVTYYATSDPKTAGEVDYPAYPDEGAIRLDKNSDSVGFPTTGVAKIKLELDGISAIKPKDIVLVADMSSSMKENITGPDGSTRKRVDVMRESIIPLIDNILGPNADGTPSQNRLAIVAFNNYDYQKISSGNNINYSTTESNNGFNHDASGRNPVVSGLVGADNINTLKNTTNQQCVEGTCQSGTNYDMGLSEAYKILAAAKAESGYNRDQAVIFMSDGAPFQYNYFRGYSGNGNGHTGKGVQWMAWLNGDASNSTINGVLNSNSYAQSYINYEGKNWWAEAIKAQSGNSCKVIDPYDTSQASNRYVKNVPGLGAKIYTVGFCLAADAEITLEQTHQTLNMIASNVESSLHADNAGDLDMAFDIITRQLNYAATDAIVTDTIGEQYTLQAGTSAKVGEQVHELTSSQFIGEAPYIMVYTQKLNAQRQVVGERLPVEKIIFTTNDSGDIIEARSSAVSNSTVDILQNGKINGKYLSYDISTKTFTCNIGNVEGDKKYELEYFVRLNGSGDGTASPGSYATNQAAIASYKNYLGNQCRMDFPVPYMAWLGAHVTYEFYMVNQNGQPINAAGAVVPIDQREILYTENQTILLNEYYIAEASVMAQSILREGYELYSPNTKYYLKAASGTNVSTAYIDDTMAKQTTFVYRPAGATYESGLYPIGQSTYNYKVNIDDYGNTHVLFAVKQKPVTINKEVRKLWQDDGNSQGTRPEWIMVELQVAAPTPENPDNMATVPGSQVRLSETNNWQHTWRNLTKYKYVNGNPTNEELVYRVVEIGVPEDYTATYATDANGNVTITNTYNSGNYSLKITKKDGQTMFLEGAGFKLYSDAECTQLAQVYTDEGLQNLLSEASEDMLYTDVNGVLHFYGLTAGDYWIKEFRTPNGYTLLMQPIKISIANGNVSITSNDQTYPATVEQNEIRITITNQKLDISMPTTAGIGGYGFQVISIALIALVILLLRRREKRQGSQNN